MKIQNQFLGVASAVVKTFACNITRIQGTSSANGFFMLFDAKALPANGAVPKNQFPVFSGAPFYWDFTDLEFLTGCVLAYSSTAETLTAAAGAEEMTGTVEGNTSVDDTGFDVAGDYTTQQNTLAAWGGPAGPKMLRRVEITGIDTHPAEDRWLMVFGAPVAGLQNGDIPIVSVPMGQSPADEAALDFWFRVCPNVSIGSTACAVAISSTGPIYTAVADTNFAVKVTSTEIGIA